METQEILEIIQKRYVEAKTRWFQSLSLTEQMELLCSFTDLALEVNPKLPELKDAQQTQRRIRIVSKA